MIAFITIAFIDTPFHVIKLKHRNYSTESRRKDLSKLSGRHCIVYFSERERLAGEVIPTAAKQSHMLGNPAHNAIDLNMKPSQRQKVMPIEFAGLKDRSMR